jgi:predicted DCC family thiol-disulfide oxidoreductase YuxK
MADRMAVKTKRKGQIMLPSVNPKGKVIYDDDCGICRAFRKSTEKKATPSRFEFIPRRDADPDDYLPHSPQAGLPDTIIFIDSTGHSFKGAAAISQIMSQIKRPWNILGKILALPLLRSAADFLYKLCARERYRISRVMKLK